MPRWAQKQYPQTCTLHVLSSCLIAESLCSQVAVAGTEVVLVPMTIPEVGVPDQLDTRTDFPAGEGSRAEHLAARTHQVGDNRQPGDTLVVEGIQAAACNPVEGVA